MRYVFGDYEVDTHRDELRHRGIPCPLESHALQVLVYLVQHRDRVVPEAELLAAALASAVYKPDDPASASQAGAESRWGQWPPAAGHQNGAWSRLSVRCHGRGTALSSLPAIVCRCLRDPRPCRPGRRGAQTLQRPCWVAPSLQCPQCQHANPAGAKFCNACATPLQLLCPSCGTENPPGAKFCHQCATPLAGPSPDARRPRCPSLIPPHI